MFTRGREQRSSLRCNITGGGGGCVPEAEFAANVSTPMVALHFAELKGGWGWILGHR